MPQKSYNEVKAYTEKTPWDIILSGVYSGPCASVYSLGYVGGIPSKGFLWQGAEWSEHTVVLVRPV